MITNEVLLPNEQCPHIDQALETCIDGSHWDPMVGECATYTKEWKDLSKSERAAAGDLGLDQNTWMRGVSPSLNYGGSPTTPFSFLGCELYAKGTDSDGDKVNFLKGLKDKSIHSVAAAVAAGYTLTEAGIDYFMLGSFDVDCVAVVNKNVLSQMAPPGVGVTTFNCPQCNVAQCSLDECSVLV